MRKLIIFMMLIIVLIPSTGISHAAAIKDDTIDLQYIGTSKHMESISSELGMNLSFFGKLVPKSEDSYDRVKVTFKIVNFVTNTTVHSESMEMTYDDIFHFYIAESDCTAPMTGTYYLEATYKCYKNGDLIETIIGQSKLLSI